MTFIAQRAHSSLPAFREAPTSRAKRFTIT